MSRIYPDYVYGDGPRATCWWDDTCDIPYAAPLTEDISCDVAIIGAGFTGLTAAAKLARSGAKVALLDAHQPGWGASGRNGGFCCLGGGKLSDAQIDAQFSKNARLEWRQAEVDAVAHVDAFLLRTGSDVDRHSQGETWLAHRPRDMGGIEEECAAIEENYGVSPEVIEASELPQHGLNAGFHGALTVPIGFALNPRKYVAALVADALNVGVSIFGASQVRDLSRFEAGWTLKSGRAKVRADQVLIATNGYSSETLPNWLAGRYIPTQSTILVTRPMSDNELGAQGWTSEQMCYDSRNLLHYFRLMPDGRFLFGVRGGLLGTAGSDGRAKARALRDFQRLFPAWAHVDITHSWSGMVCLSRRFMPFVGQVPDHPGLYCAMCFHGNGVAMGSFSGHLAAEVMLREDVGNIPQVMRNPLARFPLGRARRALMWGAYAAYAWADR